jgi:cobalt/nickel transport system permease protein
MSPSSRRRPGGYLSRVDARPKLLALLAFLVAVSLVSTGQPRSLAALAGLLLLTLLPTGLLWRSHYWLRLIPILGFASGVAVLVALSREGAELWRLGTPSLSLAVTDTGLQEAGFLLARTALAGAGLVALSLSSEGPDLISALAWFRVPPAFVAVLGSVGRTLGLVTAEAARMNRAREVRTIRPRPALALRAVGGIIGALLNRSLGRAERVHRAMVARGFDGAVPRRRPPPPVPLTHLVATSLFGCLAVALSLLPGA